MLKKCKESIPFASLKEQEIRKLRALNQKRIMKRITITVLGVLFGTSFVLGQSHKCGSMEHHEMLLANDPSYSARRAEIEAKTQQFATEYNPQSSGRALVTIPVVFHVVYQNATENISDAQLLSQIDVLNDDFRKLNSNFSQTPAAFQSVAADMEIQFCLATIDPSGNPTNGITRTQTTVSSFSTNDNVKRSNQGGKDPWNTAKYLNIWVADLGNNLLGYAQFPGGPANTDGVVLTYTSVGRPPANTFNTPYNLGRTATHEVGHWLNLYHIWGDDGSSCNGSDQVSDTPNQADANYGCPNFPTVSCNNGPNGDMFMNYMDYMDDDCATMFTNGQKTRAQALFNPGGSRVGLLTSNACSVAPPPPVDACADTVRYPFPGNPVIYGSQEDGIVAGTNVYNDLAKADKFTVSGGFNILSNAWFGFSVAEAGNAPNHQVVIKVWDDNGTGGLPGTVLGQTTVPISTIVTDVANNNYTQVTFANPITLSGSYYLGYEVAPTSGITIGVYTNEDGDANPNTAFEQFEDNTWHAYTEDASWGISVNHMIHPILEASGPVASFSSSVSTICEGNTVTFTSTSTGALTYNWTFPGGNPSSATTAIVDVTYNTPGNYGATLLVTGNCDGGSATQTTNNVVNVTSAPAEPVVSFNGSQLLVSGAVGSVQWYLNGIPINGANGATWTPSQNGNYSVVINQNGCIVGSNVVNVLSLGIEDNKETTQFAVSPNPASEQIQVIFSGDLEERNVHVHMYDLSGKVVYSEELQNLKAGSVVTIAVNRLAQGMYYLAMTTESGVSVKKIAIAH
jgi:PKD repeat protein